MIYYLKHYGKLVAELDIERKTLDVKNALLFSDQMPKLFISGEEFDKWVRQRVTPESQKGFTRLVNHFDISEDDPDVYEKLLLATKGINVKDRLWITDDFFDVESPWINLLDEDSDLIQDINESEDISLEMLNVIYTKSRPSVNMDGACEKTLIRLNGELAICKKSTQHNTCDSIMEEVAYRLGVSMGISMAPAGYLGNGISYSVIDEGKDLIMANQLLERDEISYDECYMKLKSKGCDKATLVNYVRMLLFDVITRQIDRNTTNFAFYTDKTGEYKMYRLYDNGLCLFATGIKKDYLNVGNSFTRLGRTNNTSEVVTFAVKALKSLGVKRLFKMPFDESKLLNYLEVHREEIEVKINREDHDKCTIEDIVEWSKSRYEEILEAFNSER